MEKNWKNIWLKSDAGLSLPSLKRPVRLRVRTPPFHGGDTSSNLVRATNTFIKGLVLNHGARLFFISGRMFLFQMSLNIKTAYAIGPKTKTGKSDHPKKYKPPLV